MLFFFFFCFLGFFFFFFFFFFFGGGGVHRKQNNFPYKWHQRLSDKTKKNIVFIGYFPSGLMKNKLSVSQIVKNPLFHMVVCSLDRGFVFFEVFEGQNKVDFYM